MAESKITIDWKRQVKETLLISLIGIPWAFLMCPDCGEHMHIAMIISASIWVALWKGNEVVSFFIDLKYQWLNDPVKRLIWGILGHSVFSSIAVLVIIKSYENFLNISTGNVWYTVLLGIGVTILMTLILQSREFLINWKNLAIESERIKKEAITAKYETLKNQVNPHFLFNSFNTLSNLVFEDQELAARFIKKLSEVYRYVLEVRNKELISLKEELDFVKSYVFLQKIRHENALIYEEDISGEKSIQVPPMSLQMLVENAIKHNIVSEDQPLTIKIYSKNKHLVVENNLQIKNIIKEEGSGVGLENIKARYQFLSGSPISVDESHGKFIVKLPLIDAEKK